jgi:endonuclease YncB( thermonuclease family)
VYDYQFDLDEFQDGDSIIITVDLGWDPITTRRKLRLNRIDCPPLGTVRGDAALDWLRSRLEQIPRSQRIVQSIKLKTVDRAKQEKWGRWLAELWDGGIGATNLNDELVALGLAAYWNGEGPHPATLEHRR